MRDWLVDITLFLFAVLFGLVLSTARITAHELPDQKWLFDVDQLVGVVGCGALWLRRRSPAGLCTVLMVVSSVSELVGGAAMVALFTVAVHRPMRVTAVQFALGIVSSVVFTVLRPEGDLPLYVVVLFGLAVQSAVTGWALVVRHRRELVASLRDRALRAEQEAELRAEHAQLRARESIAREMHDVLGHRLSLLSVHAGALEYRPDAPREDIARAASVIRESAHQALQDLREVIGVLRAPVQELPQPTMADLPTMIAESARAGMPVVLRSGVEGTTPDTVGRTVYRIVQESLTNVRKHAAGASVEVDVTGAATDGVTVEVTNSSGAAPSGAPGSGQGLVGLAERVALAGGRLTHGPTPSGGWRVSAWLPWPA
ncbi:sensor histidine kinase [Actinophytocola oryzae]|uniref:sensor histidine kinase n=1 Tax=Actinophytocola oryzae TaxID=502181 RepID=UPI001FB9D400|nr:histidine kinase [Actinophytocola oryzae]